MIDDDVRGQLLDQFSAAVPVTLVALGDPAWAQRVSARAGMTTVFPGPRGDLPAIGDGNVIVDGLGEVADPAAALLRLRGAAPAARVFALIPNAAFAPALAAFIGGEPLAPAYPLVAAEIDALFTTAHWRIVERRSLHDRRVAAAVPPFQLNLDTITLTVTSEDVAERLCTAAFLVVADPA